MLDLYAAEGDLPMTPIENITMVQQRDAVEAARRWGLCLRYGLDLENSRG